MNGLQPTLPTPPAVDHAMFATFVRYQAPRFGKPISDQVIILACRMLQLFTGIVDRELCDGSPAVTVYTAVAVLPLTHVGIS